MGFALHEGFALKRLAFMNAMPSVPLLRQLREAARHKRKRTVPRVTATKDFRAWTAGWGLPPRIERQ